MPTTQIFLIRAVTALVGLILFCVGMEMCKTPSDRLHGYIGYMLVYFGALLEMRGLNVIRFT